MDDKKTTKLSIEQTSFLYEIKKMIENKELPDSYPGFMLQSADAHTYTLRNTFIKNMGFVLLSKEWIKD